MISILEIKVKIGVFNVTAKTYKIIYNLLEIKVNFKFVRSQVGQVGVPLKLMISRVRGLTWLLSYFNLLQQKKVLSST